MLWNLIDVIFRIRTIFSNMKYRRYFIWTTCFCCFSRSGICRKWSRQRGQTATFTLSSKNMRKWTDNKCRTTNQVSFANTFSIITYYYKGNLIFLNDLLLIFYSYYRNASGKYVTATTGSTVATSIYPTTVAGGTHYSSYPGGAVRFNILLFCWSLSLSNETIESLFYICLNWNHFQVLSGSTAAGGPTPLSVSSLSSSSRPPTSSLATVTDVRTQNMLTQVYFGLVLISFEL